MYTAFLAPLALFSANVLSLKFETVVKAVSLHEKNDEQHNSKTIDNDNAMLVAILVANIVGKYGSI